MPLLKIADEAGVLYLRWDGDVGLAFAAADSDPLIPLLGPEGFRRQVLLDLERASFIDSSGIGWLVVCQKRFLDAGGRLVLYAIPPLILHPLKLMRMDKVLQLADDLPAARALLARATP